MALLRGEHFHSGSTAGPATARRMSSCAAARADDRVNTFKRIAVRKHDPVTGLAYFGPPANVEETPAGHVRDKVMAYELAEDLRRRTLADAWQLRGVRAEHLQRAGEKVVTAVSKSLPAAGQEVCNGLGRLASPAARQVPAARQGAPESEHEVAAWAAGGA